MTRLHEILEEKIVDENLDISYRTVDSPLGTLMLAATSEGVLRVAFEGEDFDHVLESLSESVSPRILKSRRRLDQPARQLEEYFDGARQVFHLTLDRRLSHGFRGTVQHYLPSIPFGETLSYRDVAERVGHPQAVRAVGSACATNPIPVIVPCHRVVRADGSLGGYLGGLEAKRELLRLEGSGGR
ncbi:methylated-DNA--[protein]-cysteine S-methyltransferase [uncultured Kocuria sp.]|uniref:methylated-DNA--[protein]-cysteine S-methyltransferase n=1 Tax=uncultured Kocuria sp. TaxID=259305 RepID=UPI0025959620|nr:methylated-DNA--[protein]-cysteine S-methyltransferase [uncultured Kocuria sp.]MCT1367814.1 methylated-DNA--[protein]-cysteine S-methyltransferase [Rothia sp. p3-SID1597]